MVPVPLLSIWLQHSLLWFQLVTKFLVLYTTVPVPLLSIWLQHSLLWFQLPLWFQSVISFTSQECSSSHHGSSYLLKVTDHRYGCSIVFKVPALPLHTGMPHFSHWFRLSHHIIPIFYYGSSYLTFHKFSSSLVMLSRASRWFWCISLRFQLTHHNPVLITMVQLPCHSYSSLLENSSGTLYLGSSSLSVEVTLFLLWRYCGFIDVKQT